MAAGRWRSYAALPHFTGNGTIDLERHAFAVHLFGPGSNAGDLTKRTLADLADEVRSPDYTPRALASSWDQDGESSVFAGGRVVWNAGEEPIEARYAVVVRTGTVNGVTDALVVVSRLNMAGDVLVTPGNELRLRMSELGILALGGATADT